MNLLSPREIDVVRLVACGMPDKEIGRALGISAITARNHLKNAREKLGLRNRTELCAYAFQAGLVAYRVVGAPEWPRATAICDPEDL